MGFRAMCLEGEAELGGQRPRRHIVGSRKGGKEVIHRTLIGHIDRGELKTPFVFISAKQVVIPHRQIEQMTGSDAGRVVIVTFCSGCGYGEKTGSVLTGRA